MVSDMTALVAGSSPAGPTKHIIKSMGYEHSICGMDFCGKFGGFFTFDSLALTSAQ
jgi:hypothetical protein